MHTVSSENSFPAIWEGGRKEKHFFEIVAMCNAKRIQDMFALNCWKTRHLKKICAPTYTHVRTRKKFLQTLLQDCTMCSPIKTSWMIYCYGRSSDARAVTRFLTWSVTSILTSYCTYLRTHRTLCTSMYILWTSPKVQWRVNKHKRIQHRAEAKAADVHLVIPTYTHGLGEDV